MRKLIEIDVNKIRDLIEDRYGYQHGNIVKVDVASAKNQHKPKSFEVNYGGVLTIYFQGEKLVKL